MRSTVFWDVDTQHDFLMPEGGLYVRGAEAILPRLKALTDFAHGRTIAVLGSVDFHSPSDPEISDHPDFQATYPPHCLAGTPGQDKVPETRPRDPLWIDSRPEAKGALKRRVRAHLEHGGEVLFRKQRFDVFSNPNVDTVLDAVRPDRIVIYGVALDVCDRYAVEGFLDRKRYRIALVEDATRAIHPEEAPALLEAWTGRGVTVLTTAQVLAGALGV